MFEGRTLLPLIFEIKIDLEDETYVEDDNYKIFAKKKICSLVNLFRSLLQSVLLSLTKVCLAKPPVNKDCPQLGDAYKYCYALSLKLNDVQKKCDFISKLIDTLLVVENKINLFYKDS